MNSARNTGGILICFAVRDEARHFTPADTIRTKVIVTGIGHANARNAFLDAIAISRPGLVLTCGYAGGLNPQLKRGDVAFDADVESGLATSLGKLGAHPAVFHCVNRIAVTVAEKRALRQQTRAEVVEMESGVIRALCRERGIAAATIRVISDDAASDLPLDFNALAKPDGNISYPKLAAALVRSPRLIRRLIRFQKELGECSRNLATTLNGLLAMIDK
jgi:adenosylhomocysteine nucleosidase